MKTLEEVQSSSKTKMKKPELLAPAGNLEKLKIAVKSTVYAQMQIISLWKKLQKVWLLRTVMVLKFT